MDSQETFNQTLERRLVKSKDYPCLVKLCQQFISATTNELVNLKLLDNSGMAEYNQLQGELRAYNNLIELQHIKE